MYASFKKDPISPDNFSRNGGRSTSERITFLSIPYKIVVEIGLEEVPKQGSAQKEVRPLRKRGIKKEAA